MAAVTKVITEKATLSFPHLFEAQASRDGTGKAKFSAALVFAPGTDLTKIHDAITAAAEAKWPNKSAAMFKSGSLRNPIRRDGEEKGYGKDSTFINVRSEQPPGLVYSHAGTDGKPAIIPKDKIKEDLYPGAQVRASLAAFAYDTNGNKGVSFALNNIQKLGDGARLDNRVAAEDEFTADLSQTPASLDSLV